ncbi:F-box/LRR-repeat protein 4-like isoform X2 [Schistocerca piceifrons]|nr:F-box/LRR-repeat protein 4-like isoform X2 [Schistocerca piceifrons]XP_047100492.1 F-box/LRR-repeat protein 4-like isoform X2 [Schistocerca piceifrons]XP_047100493.1 F-box/LRR-repeat protein 4-like isoform X2 [Schistocerca piceifrons]XP_047100494.1 F-box/LRR-repeat protein 4-like isoform X2 [Schistocerca piceifrons]XP_047100495.1 F-box/LRR-repeat protein 4-like isoform X2 [Schistocerca piceifrons]
MSSSSLPSRASEDANTASDSSVSPTSATDRDNVSDLPLISDLQLNNTSHSEGDSPLQAGSSTSKLDKRGTTIDDLPDELVVEIFSYMSFSENIEVLQKVCTRWKILAQDAHLWLNKKYVVRWETSEEEAIATFDAVPQLRTVIMEKDVSHRVFEALSRSCPHLTTLQTSPWQMLTYTEADNLFTSCRDISTLAVTERGLREDVRFLEAMARLTDLRVLHLYGFVNTEMAIPLHILADVCPHLCDLNLDSICYQIRDAEYFVSSHRCVLERLRMRWTSVEGRSIAPLLPTCAETLQQLELICYENVSLEEAAEAFTALGQLHNLRQLLIVVTDWNVRHLVPAVFENGGFPKLQQLQLACIVVDETMRGVVEHCPELRELELHGCEGHTDALFETLRRLKKLETLKINSCTCLGGKSMSHIAKLTTLHTLEFTYTKFGKLKPSVDCILEMSGLRRLYLHECICWAIPFDKFPGRLVNLRELEIGYCDGDQDVLDRITAQMPDLRVDGSLGALFTDQEDDD